MENMEKLKENDTGLGWNYAKGTIDALEEWWKSRLQVVLEAHRFKTACIDHELEEKLDQMFRGILATGDEAWAPSSGILPSDFVEHEDIEALDEIEEENAIIDNMIHATSRLTLAMDPFGTQHAIKILDGLSEEVPKASEL
ncbi:hypothetical protein GQ457_14G012700 [Hibiscus cannabinus]